MVIIVGASAYRGQSNCVILGKYAYIKDNGGDQSIESYDVIGNDINRSTLQSTIMAIIMTNRFLKILI